MNEYKSVSKEASSEIIEKKSRFICSVKPVNSEKEAVDFVKEIRDKYKDATHNVFAYVVMAKIEIQKASDDGEPQGTAGIPVLEVIKREGLKNICVVVTRYFGGTLLGAGGLIRAYSSSAKAGIDKALICTKALYSRLSVKIDYAQLGRVKNAIEKLKNKIVSLEYREFVVICIDVRYDNIDTTIKKLTDITNGQAKIKNLKRFYGISQY